VVGKLLGIKICDNFQNLVLGTNLLKYIEYYLSGKLLLLSSISKSQ